MKPMRTAVATVAATALCIFCICRDQSDWAVCSIPARRCMRSGLDHQKTGNKVNYQDWFLRR